MIAKSYFPEYPISILLVFSLIGSIIPDVDHLFYLFIYGRQDSYAKTVRQHLSSHQYSQAIDYCRTHHKNNFFILSHNLLTPIFVFLIFFYFVFPDHPILSALSLAILSHFIFDILEDLLVHGHLNPNWFLKFSHPQV
jgi:hypothetical protein